MLGFPEADYHFKSYQSELPYCSCHILLTKLVADDKRPVCGNLTGPCWYADESNQCPTSYEKGMQIVHNLASDQAFTIARKKDPSHPVYSTQLNVSVDLLVPDVHYLHNHRKRTPTRQRRAICVHRSPQVPASRLAVLSCVLAIS